MKTGSGTVQKCVLDQDTSPGQQRNVQAALLLLESSDNEQQYQAGQEASANVQKIPETPGPPPEGAGTAHTCVMMRRATMKSAYLPTRCA